MSESTADPSSIEQLLATALWDTHAETAWQAVQTLHNYGGTLVLTVAQQLCQHPDPQKRRLGIEALLLERMIAPEYFYVDPPQLGIPKGTAPPTSITLLHRLLATEQDLGVLAAAGFALGHLKDSQAIEPLFAMQHHPSAEVRLTIVRSLLGHTTPQAIQILIRLSTDPEDQVRSWATFGLGSMITLSEPAILAALEARLRDHHEETRAEAILGLAYRKDERIIPLLQQDLTRTTVSSLCVEAAQALGDSRLYPLLIDLQKWWDLDKPLLEAAIRSTQP